MKLTEILYDLEFDYKVNEDNTLTLIDLQSANLGGIEQEKFLIDKNIAITLINRLENYIRDYFVNGYINTLTEECDEDMQEESYTKILDCMKKYPKIFDKECEELMQCLINPLLLNIADIEADKLITKTCPRCGTRLRHSCIKGYTFYCPDCEEDFYKCEV